MSRKIILNFLSVYKLVIVKRKKSIIEPFNLERRGSLKLCKECKIITVVSVFPFHPLMVIET